MNDFTLHKIKTGVDPRTLPDYVALRDELSKLTHPARPDVNWMSAEKFCLNLFEHNGADLQTAAWYTLVRSHQAGMRGMNEGLAILEPLITRHWGVLWPYVAHIRVSILGSLARRLQQYLRTQTLSHADLSALYQAEKHLSAITDALQHLELKYQTGLEAVLQQIHHAALRLENGDTPETVYSAGQTVNDCTAAKDTAGVIASLQETDIPAVSHIPAEPVSSVPLSSWRPFLAGMFTMLVIGTVIIWGCKYITDRPEQQALMASVAPLPEPIPSASLDELQKKTAQVDKAWFAQARERLNILASQSPVWSLNYGRQLVRQAQYLWPSRPETTALSQQWQHYLATTAAPEESLEGWHQGMEKLQQLASQLNGLDEKKGQYMTVSELKSNVFDIIQSFNQMVPVEEKLRQLQPGVQTAGVSVPVALRARTELHLRQLLVNYAQLISPQEIHDVAP